MKHLLNPLLPKIRIHSWGGFGSQLFTAMLVMKLQKYFSGRRLKVIVHTSGVTRREVEFDFSLLGVEAHQIDDFDERTKINEHMANKYYRNLKIEFRFRQYVALILRQLGFVQDSNTDSSFNSIKPWTFALRGHYSNLTFDRLMIRSLCEVLFTSQEFHSRPGSDIVIHYRLGDLLNLKEKSPINPERIAKVFEGLPTSQKAPTLLSDSTLDQVESFISGSQFLEHAEIVNYDPVETLHICTKAEVFIGTGAKISLWAALFRYFVYDKISFLPEGFMWATKMGLRAKWY
jgi:hypothetical protein